MKILLQDRDNSLFFQRLGAWTSSYQEAFDFKQARIAMDFANLYRIENARMLVVSVTHDRRLQMLPFELPAAVPTRSAMGTAPQHDALHPGMLEAGLEPACTGHARK